MQLGHSDRPDRPERPLPAVEIRSGGVSLGGRPILRDIDLTIDQGEVVALLGPNGSGKSTLVKAIVGLHQLTRGSLRILGEPSHEFRDRTRLGYVPQHSTITQGVPTTVGEVVSAGVLARRTPFLPTRLADREAITAALAYVGLSDRRGYQVSTLSGGQKQRVLIARALAGRPDLMLLDEPNAGVDAESQQAIADTLAQRSREGATLVIVLHELGPLAPLITRAVMLREGRIEYDGSPHLLVDHHDHAHHHDPYVAGLEPPPAPPLARPPL